MMAWRAGAEGKGGGVGGIDVVLVGKGTKMCGALGLLAWLVSTQKVRRWVRRQGLCAKAAVRGMGLRGGRGI